MKQFLAVLILGLVVMAALIEAKPSRHRQRGGRGQGGKNQKSQCITPCDLDGEILDDCDDGTTCTSDPVTLTFGGQDFDVKVCVPEAETTNTISKALMKKACEATNSTGFRVKATRTCHGDDTCIGGPVSFSVDDDTVTATFCQDTDEAFDFKDFLEDLGEHRGKSSNSESQASSQSEESSESEEDATTSAPLP